MNLVGLRPPVLCAPFFMSCEVMEFAEVGHRQEKRPDLPVSLLIVLHTLRLECEKSMDLTASSHRSCFFCYSRDEAALSESVPTRVWMKERQRVSHSLSQLGTQFFLRLRGIHCLAAKSRLSQKSWHALSIFGVSAGGNLLTDSPVRRQKRFHSALQKFQRFSRLLWAGTLNLGGFMREGRCCYRGSFPRTRPSDSRLSWPKFAKARSGLVPTFQRQEKKLAVFLLGWMLPRSPGSHRSGMLSCNPGWHASSWSRQHADWGVETAGWSLGWVTSVEVCRRWWSCILRRLLTTTQSLIVLETDWPVTVPTARGQTWQGHGSCSGLTQLERSWESLACLQLCSGSPVGQWWKPCSYS